MYCWIGIFYMLFATHGLSFQRLPLIIRRALKIPNKNMTTEKHNFDYDLIVIGGGSGGMSAAKQAAGLGAKVALFDYVKPSTQGTTWGLGGTCVNVGCVPKKLMHYTGLLGQGMHDAAALGWEIEKKGHNWEKLAETVSNHVRMLNFRYRVGLRSKNVNYINAHAEFKGDSHTVGYFEKGANGGEKIATAANILIAVGGRPHIPTDIPGAVEYAITSDDIFSLDRAPGKTLCVGASYIALECAGFLTELGYDVTVAARSILLRGFDVQCGEKLGELLTDLGTNIIYKVQVTSIAKQANGKLLVTLKRDDGSSYSELYDTVLFATGRLPDLKGLHLEIPGVKVNPTNGKIPVSDTESTNVPHVFAVGDVCEGKQELTPVAIKAGELLAKRLFGGATAKMNYALVPTAVFTPVEYGTVGLTEEQAIELYGAADVEVYLTEFTTLEHSAVHRTKHARHGEDVDMGHGCLSKLITVKSLNEKVVGFHFIGPSAGEITQGFALAVKLGATKADFDDLVGIHPTDAESFCALQITKRSGISWSSEGGCGGGVCG